MKWLFAYVLFLFPFLSGAQLPGMSTILNTLPDTAFTYCDKLTFSKTFSVKERELILNGSDSTNFRLDIHSDSLHEISFSGGDYISVHIKYWVGSKNEIYIAVIQSQCDFVMCFQKNSFYKLKKGKLSAYRLNYFDLPLSHFFNEKQLDSCGIDPKKGCKEYTLKIEKDRITVHFQEEYTSKELMGEEGKYTCLENTGIHRKHVSRAFYYFRKNKFIFTIGALNS